MKVDPKDGAIRRNADERVSAILVGLELPGMPESFQEPLEELRLLADTAGADTVDKFVQKRPKPDPATYIDFFDAVRFCNWLHNGKPQGEAGSGTTEDGAYAIDGSDVSLRKPGAKYSLPSENEWYKGAYYDPAAAAEFRYGLFARGFGGGFRVRRYLPNHVTAFGVEDIHNEVWEWNDPSDENRVAGTAVDFCRDVTQNRNVADTELDVVGETAAKWMSIAQCFAGGPVDPPAPGERAWETR